jgi:M6 family metalloprotease-like protein
MNLNPMIAAARTLTTLLLFGVGLAIPLSAPTQTEVTPKSSEGYYISPYGRLHMLIVYAEMEFDSSYAQLDPEKNPEGGKGWKVHRLPYWREKIISPTPDGDGFMTRYFRQASFGRFEVTGDFLDTLITVPISTVRDGRGNIVPQEAYGNNLYRKAVLDRVNAMRKPRLHWGSDWADFDRWNFTGNGYPNKLEPNGRHDLVVVIWRNIHVAYLGEFSGFVTQGDFGQVQGKGTDMYSIFKTSSQSPEMIMRHEFSHMLYGANNFHTAGGGVGTRTFMSTLGGWSNMSAADNCSPVWNAWDRERLAWRNPGNQYVLSTRCAQGGQEIDGALAYGQQLCGDGVLMLRDFVTTGDAIKIALPHIPGTTEAQYLWLENHQRREGFIDHEKTLVPGLYAYIQVGKDEREGKNIFAGENNYLWPLVAAGNYDFRYEPEGMVLVQEAARANPFTGHHYLMRHCRDKGGDGKITVGADVAKTEFELPKDLRIDGKAPPDSFFSYQRYPIFGTRTVAFLPERGRDKIGIGTNPAATPIYSHGGQQPRPSDNRRVFLNGISIELLRIDAGGNAFIRVRWDDFEVGDDLRWCGDILLTEQLRLKNGAAIRLDQGYAVQVTAPVQTIAGEAVYAEPTILELKAGSTLSLGRNAQLIVEPGSSLLVRKGARITAERGAQLIVRPGAYLHVEEGNDLSGLPGSARSIDAGAVMGIHPLLSAKHTGLLKAIPVR